MFSSQGSVSDNTGGGMYLIRCGFNGNNYVLNAISESYKYESYKPAIGVNSNGEITISCSISGEALLMSNR